MFATDRNANLIIYAGTLAKAVQYVVFQPGKIHLQPGIFPE